MSKELLHKYGHIDNATFINVTLPILAGGHGLVPVSWRKCWCVVKNGSMYCYKTSFDNAALHLYQLSYYDTLSANEKKKM